MGEFLSRRFLLFLLAGGVAALANFGSRIVYDRWMSFAAAVVFAYLTGMATAFALNRAFVFRHSAQPAHVSALYFALVNALAIAQTLAISLALVEYALPWMGVTWHADEVAHAVGVVVPVFTSYLGHSRWSFR